MTRPKSTFTAAAAKNTPKKRRDFPHAYDELIGKIERATHGIDEKFAGKYKNPTMVLNEVERELDEAFTTFLETCNFRLALKNFEALKKELETKNRFRDDGTVGWYHQVLPLIAFMSPLRKGEHRNGIDIKSLTEYGGLEVALITHLRHDSIEDFFVGENGEEELRSQQYEFLEEIRQEGYEGYATSGPRTVEQSMTNIVLMSQMPLRDENGNIRYNNDGKKLKENVFSFVRRLVYSDKANPIPFALKQLDNDYNFATMPGAPKFTPDRVAKRCNEKENMYGPRQSFFRDALKKWKPFAKAFTIFDANMGECIYKLFRGLENVQLFYQNSQDAFRREPNNDPVSDEFLRDALRLDLPEAIHPLHIFLKRLNTWVDPVEEPEKYERLQTFMENVVKPSLEAFKDKFPYLFKKSENMQLTNQLALTPVAFR